MGNGGQSGHYAVLPLNGPRFEGNQYCIQPELTPISTARHCAHNKLVPHSGAEACRHANSTHDAPKQSLAPVSSDSSAPRTAHRLASGQGSQAPDKRNRFRDELGQLTRQRLAPPAALVAPNVT